jgi:hypothetical protein
MAKFDPKAKAKRQKIILAVLGVVLVGVLIFQAPKIMGMFGGGSSTAASEPASSTPSTTPAATPTPTPSPTPTPGVVTPTGGTAELVDSDPAAVPADGQLVTFDRFESKDPFAQQADDTPEGQTGAPNVPVDTTAKADDPDGTGAQPEPSPAPKTGQPIAARISVNGVTTHVRVGATFPESDPIFKLVSLTKTSAKVGIVGGSYATGSQTITLKKGGKPVTLMNTADGTTYVLRLGALGFKPNHEGADNG